VSQMRVLGAIRRGLSTPGEIAGRHGVSVPTVSKALSVLERDGLVERVRDPRDRRRVIATVTPEGERLLRECHENATRRLSESLETLSDEELDIVLRGMTLLDEALDRHCSGCQHSHG